MKIYKGQKSKLGPPAVAVVFPDASYPNYRLPHIKRHSPDGFNWGYGGSGPADLALSILTDFAGKDVAEKLYQKFKSEFIALADSELSIPDVLILEWIEKQGFELKTFLKIR